MFIREVFAKKARIWDMVPTGGMVHELYHRGLMPLSAPANEPNLFSYKILVQALGGARRVDPTYFFQESILTEALHDTPTFKVP